MFFQRSNEGDKAVVAALNASQAVIEFTPGGDILTANDNFLACVGYRLDGQELDYYPSNAGSQARVEPIYETFEGWKDTTRGARSWAELPAQAVKYVRHIEELIQAPVALLSTSPEREDTILVRDPFAD